MMQKLTNDDGNLSVGGDLLIYRYPAGDVDLIPWPLKVEDYETRTVEKLRAQLAASLYDAFETGQLQGNDRNVELPDGEVFNIDDNLVD